MQIGDAQRVEWAREHKVDGRALDPAVQRQAKRAICSMPAAAFEMKAAIGAAITLRSQFEQRRVERQVGKNQPPVRPQGQPAP